MRVGAGAQNPSKVVPNPCSPLKTNENPWKPSTTIENHWRHLENHCKILNNHWNSRKPLQSAWKLLKAMEKSFGDHSQIYEKALLFNRNGSKSYFTPWKTMKSRREMRENDGYIIENHCKIIENHGNIFEDHGYILDGKKNQTIADPLKFNENHSEALQTILWKQSKLVANHEAYPGFLSLSLCTRTTPRCPLPPPPPPLPLFPPPQHWNPDVAGTQIRIRTQPPLRTPCPRGAVATGCPQPTLFVPQKSHGLAAFFASAFSFLAARFRARQKRNRPKPLNPHIFIQPSVIMPHLLVLQLRAMGWIRIRAWFSRITK